MEFLRAVAKIFADSSENRLFVFPNRRSIMFFLKYLGIEHGNCSGKPMFAPQTTTVNDLFLKLSGLKAADPIETQYLLYNHYVELVHGGDRDREPFDEFINWGNVIVSDFNDIDKYFIDARQLFSNIRDLKEIEEDFSFLSVVQREAIRRFWGNFARGDESFKKEKFISLWSVMYELYSRLRASLSARGEGYEGMIYRSVAGRIDEFDLGNLVFVGFNAPNACEKILMKRSRDAGGDFYWDFYGEMVTDPDNKSSMFIESLRKEFPSRHLLPDDATRVTALSDLEINLYGVPSGVGGAILACDILRKHIGDDPLKTAVLLPDEKLLIPLLSSIPQEYGKVNVTMGYPVTATPLPDFMNMLAGLQRNVVEQDGKSLFHHASVRALLSHRYLKAAAGSLCSNICENIVRENRIYISSDDPLFTGSESGLVRKVFRSMERVQDIIDWQREILEEIESAVEHPDKDFIYCYYKALEKLKKLDLPLGKAAYFRLLRQMTSMFTVPFRGEPLEGLQIMGPLEIRSLDFDNIIILSANEGLFPATAAAPSLIPYNLRLGFGLPTYQLQDAISAYHFYRSICRARNLYMIYDSRAEGLNRGEESRYIKQLKYHYECRINGHSVTYPLVNGTVQIEPLAKSDAIMEKMRNLYMGDGGGYLSASAINCYIDCPLKFYHTYVEGIREQDDVIEELDAGKFGELFHAVIQRLYAPYLNEVLSADLISRLRTDREGRIDNIIDEYFAREKLGKISGENLIVKEVIKRYIAITLGVDARIAPFCLHAAEKRMFCSMELPGTGTVRLKAIIDRIDSTDAGLRIADYKTGKVVMPGKKDFDISQLFNVEKVHYKELFQLYFYAYVFSRDGGMQDPDEFRLVIYNVPELLKKSFTEHIATRDSLEAFGQMLKECIGGIFNQQIPFSPSSWNSEGCRECKFKLLCRHR